MVLVLQHVLHQHEQFGVIFYNQDAVGIVNQKCIGVHLDIQVDFMLLVDLILFEGFLGDRDLQGESRTLTFFALAADGTLVQVYEIVCQCQAETCADGFVLAVFFIIETLE